MEDCGSKAEGKTQFLLPWKVWQEPTVRGLWFAHHTITGVRLRDGRAVSEYCCWRTGITISSPVFNSLYYLPCSTNVSSSANPSVPREK